MFSLIRTPLKNRFVFFLPININFTRLLKKNISQAHVHPVYHIMIIISGSGKIANNSGIFSLKQGDVILVNPGEKHVFTAKDQDLVWATCNFYLFKAGCFSKVIALIKPAMVFTEINKICETEPLENFFNIKTVYGFIEYKNFLWQKIISLVDNFIPDQDHSGLQYSFADYDKKLLLNYQSFVFFFSELCAIFDPYKNPENNQKKIQGTGLVLKIKNLLLEQIEEKYSLKKLAAGLGLSPEYICSYFTRSAGKTIHEYSTGLKISRAAEYLKNSGLSITEIAYRLAFSSPQHFSGVFRKYKFVSPLVFRKSVEIQ
ncbi:MAG: hypothetical protein A2096_01675 [Spirochaetes bacterium GWF1_41_5]|nr:MAG: hypothetical protein A2096_01675 [Spirochaetes bacterium GWF1_41_5]HBE02506.1 hypothetical protein [Spirochaetia bacterium]